MNLPMPYAHTIGIRRYQFEDLRTLLAKTSSVRSGDQLAGVTAADAKERVAAQMAMTDLPLTTFLVEAVPIHTPAATAPRQILQIRYGAFQTLRQPVSRIHQEAMAPNSATAASSSSPAR